MRWDDYAAANNLPGGRGGAFSEKMTDAHELGYDEVHELDDMRSVASSIKQGSTVYNGGLGGGLSIPNPMMGGRSSMYALGGGQRASFVGQAAGAHARSGSVGSDVPLARPISTVYPVVSGSAEHLPSPNSSATALRSRSNLGLAPPGNSGSPRPVSMAVSNAMAADPRLSTASLGPVNFMDGPKTGPSDTEISAAVRECLSEVDIERFTKKQLVALVELKLQCQVTGERKKVLERWIDVELERMPG
jgi:chitin synthase